MGFGPLFVYRDDAHLDHLLDATRELKIEIVRDEPALLPRFVFRRAWGVVEGACWPGASAMHFTFVHGNNPLPWLSDHCLLRDIEKVFLANGSSRVDPLSLSSAHASAGSAHDVAAAVLESPQIAKTPMVLRPPALLEQLVADGRWPRTREEQHRQPFRPLVSAERVKRLAPEESEIYLYAPPFQTVREGAAWGTYWMDPMSAPSEIDFDLALDIGDFGLGSDAPILLDYRENLEAPRVIRLRWSYKGRANHWVLMAPDFETFVRELEL